MAVQLVALRVDADEPLALARFWAEALGWRVVEVTAHETRLIPTDSTRFRLDFVSGAEPKVGRSRLHLDLTTASLDDQRHSAAGLVELGARHIDIGQAPEEGHLVLTDPEGNEFCLIGPGNSFLAGCGRLGSITCEGMREVGCFWSAALGWPLVWDQDGETAIRAPDGTGPLITWGGPPVPPKHGRNRLRLDLSPLDTAGLPAEIDRLVALGATRVDNGPADPGRVVMTDPDDNEFTVVTPASWGPSAPS